ncbi:DedA family protein [Thiohalocapsa marina]|uniref:DedA family protein n=1 Tax=Thiohalocapsa marina TaxID=424902 RepID=A0A5M8FTA1_9GAMM|nr:YqaA family protein [Thiohalocapsa marina]KAA6187034.1 DedA family protein [Thiohalocapsa marina]
MRLFSPLYDRVMAWSRHRHAQWYLGGLSFAESSFFPIPPDVMLAPMSMARPASAWRFALITTLASVAGGLLGYVIGAFAFELIEPLVGQGGRYHEAFEQGRAWFDQWGVWAVFLAGFSPIPYKIFTITAGVLSMALLPFLLASAVGRGARFFLVAALMAWGGEPMERRLRQYVDTLGWLMLLLIALVVMLY